MSNLKSQIESLLFIAAKPLAVKQLAELLETDAAKIKAAGDELVAEYKSSDRGLALLKNEDKYQLVSSPANTAAVNKFIGQETSGELSRPSLEALTIIAYRGPIAKGDLDKIRGVNCALILRNLLLRGLIESKEVKGEDYYQVSLDFIKFLGVSDVSQLPDYQRLHNEVTVEQVLNAPTGEV